MSTETASLMVVNHAEGQVAVSSEAQRLRDEALAAAALVGVVKNPKQQENAVAALKLIKGVRKGVEEARKAAKEPYLETGRRIDAAAKEFDKALAEDELRINREIGNYQQELLAEQRRQEAERQAELRRIEEEERKAREEVARKIEEEKQRLAEESAKAKNAEDAARIEAERIANAKKAEEELARQAELAKQKQEMVGPAPVTAQAKGQSSREVFDFEVTDIWLLARMHPGMVKIEENRQEILDALNKHGVREIKGLRIFTKVETRIRTASKTIDV